jgi:hypothetical protein
MPSKARILQVSLFLALLVSGTQAQEADSSLFNKGTYSLAGSITFDRTTSPGSDRTITDVSVAPLYLHFLSSRFAMGGQAEYTYHKTTSDDYASEEYSVGLGPQLRYYFLVHPIHTFFSATVIFTSGGRTWFGISHDAPDEILTSLNLGADFFLARSLSLEPFVQYRMRLNTGSSNINTVTLGISVAHFVFND